MKHLLLYLGMVLLVVTGCAPVPAANQATTQTAATAVTTSASPVGKISPTARPELEASDPAKFNLAAGKLQLVEFFAFW